MLMLSSELSAELLRRGFTVMAHDVYRRAALMVAVFEDEHDVIVAHIGLGGRALLEYAVEAGTSPELIVTCKLAAEGSGDVIAAKTLHEDVARAVDTFMSRP